MHEIVSNSILFVLGVLSSFLNVNAGGGSTITLPALIFLGMDAATANGTNRIAILLQNISAVSSFRSENFHHFPLSLSLSLYTLPGAVIGAYFATTIGNETFKIVLGIVMIGIVISMLFPTRSAGVQQYHNEAPGWGRKVAMVCIGFYGGFIQVGVGFLLMAALHYLLHIDLVRVNMHKVFIVLIYTIPALGIFLYAGNVQWIPGLSLAAGSALGGWWAAKLSVKKGEWAVKIFLVIAIIFMAFKLFNLF